MIDFRKFAKRSKYNFAKIIDFRRFAKKLRYNYIKKKLPIINYAKVIVKKKMLKQLIKQSDY